MNYNDRIILDDGENNIQDINYGNNIIDSDLKWMTHGTKMAGGVSSAFKQDKVEIMTVATYCYGDEHDKDIALAIRYAVDNGAKVINMSFSKEFTKNFAWVKSAIQYAEQNDVLIISGAGNFGKNLNIKGNDSFPNDSFDGSKEFSDNFLLVGSANASFDKNFRRKSSNYGNTQVDLFAPGEKILTIGVKKNIEYTNAVSAASAITSGVAALIRSYYPSLTASQVKHILMDSGLEFTIEVSTPTKDDKNKTTPFNQLSKSGKYLNAYNALLMAKKISRQQ